VEASFLAFLVELTAAASYRNAGVRYYNCGQLTERMLSITSVLNA